MNTLYFENVANSLLGCLIQDPSLCLNDKYPLDNEEFLIQFHRVIYVVINELAHMGNKSINIMDVNEFLKPYESQYNIYLDSNGDDYIETISSITDVENFENYYNQFRKTSCLREYRDNGMDIKDIYDVDKNENEQLQKLNEYSIEDIVNYFESKQSKIRKKFFVSQNTEEMICGDGCDELLDELEVEPMIGAGLCSPMLNSLYRGWCRGHLILRGAPSGVGKTTMGISDLCNVSSLKLWDDKSQDFVDNPYYQGKGCYIHSEQKMRKEIQPRFLSTVSQVPYDVVLDGKFTKEQKERLSEAGAILKKSELKLFNYPEFTSSGIESYIKDISLNGYQYVTEDYIWNNFYIGAELKKMSGTAIREDMALLKFADTLKLTAERYNVAIATMIQLNGNEKESAIVDESCLFGSKSIKTKLDNGSIYMEPRPKELKQVEKLIDKWNKEHNTVAFGGRIEPNAVSHCFKTRYSRYGRNIKVWHLVDNGIGKMTDMFATTWDNKPIDIPSLYIKTKGE